MNTFHDLMLVVQEKSEGKLPHSIVHFMEQTLSEKTQLHLLKAVNSGNLSVEDIINAMVDAGKAADNGSVERIDEYLLRVLN